MEDDRRVGGSASASARNLKSLEDATVTVIAIAYGVLRRLGVNLKGGTASAQPLSGTAAVPRRHRHGDRDQWLWHWHSAQDSDSRVRVGAST